MVARVHDGRIRQQILAGRADGSHAGARALTPRQRFGCRAHAHAPHIRRVLDFDGVVNHVDIARRLAFALDHHRIVARKLDARANHTAAVRVNHQMPLGDGRQGANSGAARQGNARGRQGPHGEYDLVFRSERVGSRRNLVIHDFVGKAHAANVVLVGLGRLGCDGSRGQINTQNLTGPAVRYRFRHSRSPLRKRTDAQSRRTEGSMIHSASIVPEAARFASSLSDDFSRIRPVSPQRDEAAVPNPSILCDMRSDEQVLLHADHGTRGFGVSDRNEGDELYGGTYGTRQRTR